ncbi:MAG: discoidin domain-containing protein [Thermomicrobiales bacterium]
MTDNVKSELARYAIDQDRTTAWYADALPLETANVDEATPGAVVDEPDGVFLELDLGSVVSVGLVRWSFADLESADLYEVQISSDGETWQGVTLRDNPQDFEWQEIYIGADAQYVRFLFQNPNGDLILGGLSEVEVYAP